jgi:hypothetical protein
MSKVKDALCIEYGEFDVSEDRDKYIGGSDLPVICGISKFKTRWQLLLEKAGLAKDTFGGNRFTEYGHYIEPFIRDHINLIYNTQFVPNRVINGDIRCHTDGFNGMCVLEIKSTSEIFSTVDGYKVYLVQLVKYMEQNGVEEGILAVYERPEDLNRKFDPTRLQVFEIFLDDCKGLLKYVNCEIDKFREDLARLKENPLLSEQDFLPVNPGMITLTNKILAFEKQLSEMKDIETQLKEAKKQLYVEMLKHGVKSWELPNGTKLSRVDEIPGKTKTVTEFDSERFKAENPGLFQNYLRKVEKETKGRSGYVRILSRRVK